VIGDPVGHSLSPVLHNAAFAAAGLDWVYVALRVAPGRGAAALEAMRDLGLAGLSVTTPHKADVAAAVDRLSPVAEALGAVNCVRWDGDELVGENTDGDGFVSALATEIGFHPRGRRCVVIGAGSAARAVIAALADGDASQIGVLNRSPGRALAAVELAGAAGIHIGADDADGALRDADLIIQATTVGMADSDDLPVGIDSLHADQIVAELIYHPAETAFLGAARRAGATGVNGLGMLVGQAGIAFGHWTGVSAPVDAMRDAVVDRLV
jgi:shikimate dehydrogenase